ncbi:hypothetical protein CMI46_00885 [Candidatus Pacearchaeota archaeon]|nr:hypothetical protein [Candidatus Pacearchaeota archaeon]|tara:strand:- start:321 stop:1103 length:783 start_codon:yes stop_codon:yes gene_type:complete
MEEQKILVAAPISEHCEYCIEKFLKSIKEIDYPNYDILLIDNSRNHEFVNSLKKKHANVLFNYLKLKEKFNLERVCITRNKILEFALKNNYSHVLMLDSDVIVPKNILRELIGESKGIVSGLYYGAKNINGVIKEVPICWKLLNKEEFDEIKSKVNLPQTIKELKDLPRHITKEEIGKGGIQEVFFPSPGCMLISKKVFSKIKYSINDMGNRLIAEDTSFFLDCYNQGIKMYCRPDLLCEHLYKEKYEKDGVNPCFKHED